MRIVMAVFLICFSAFLICYSGMSVLKAISSPKEMSFSDVELVRIEGKNCPLYFPKSQQ